MEPVRFGVVGIIGYALTHLKGLRTLQGQGVELWGVVAKFPEENPELLDELRREGVRIFAGVEEMLEAGRGVLDVVTLPTSIPSHAPLAVQAMRAGYHVYCEKPPAATVQDVDRMIATSAETGRACAIGFQGIYMSSTQSLKRALLSGELGEVRRIACRYAAPRPLSYYRRNRWAGRLASDGAWVLDGPMNNAFAHQLQAMLFLAGSSQHEAAVPRTVQAELYRSKPYIESDDTGCLRVECEGGTSIYFVASHSVSATTGPDIEIETTTDRIRWNIGDTVAVRERGEPIQLGGEDESRYNGFLNVADVVRGRAAAPLCRVGITRGFVVCINGAHESSGRIHPVPAERTQEWNVEGRGGPCTVIPELPPIMERAFAERALFSEIGVEWAVPTPRVDVTGYSHFPRTPGLHGSSTAVASSRS